LKIFYKIKNNLKKDNYFKIYGVQIKIMGMLELIAHFLLHFLNSMCLLFVRNLLGCMVWGLIS